MVLQLIRSWSVPAQNKLVEVFYSNDPAREITATAQAIDGGQPVVGGVGTGPRDGIAAGTELLRFCEGPDLVVITASDAVPFGTFAVTVNSPTCDGSTFVIVRATGFAPISPATTGRAEVQGDGGTAPYSLSIGGFTAAASATGLATVSGLAPGAYVATLTDGAGAVRTASLIIPAAVINGCTLPGALNYNPAANTNDGTCEFVAVDQQPGPLVAAHAPVPVRMRAAPIGLQPALVLLTLETAATAAGPWTPAGTLRQACDPITATVAFNVSELCKALLRIMPPVEAGIDPALSALCRLRYVVRSAVGVDTYADTLTPFRVLNATALRPVLSDPLSYPPYNTRPAGTVLWSNTATLDAVSADAVDASVAGSDWPCPVRHFVWLNPFGGWDHGFFAGRHQHGTDQADPIGYRDAAGADRYAHRGTVRPTLQVYSDKLTRPVYDALRGIRNSIQVYERTGVNQYVPVLVAAASYAEYQEQTDKTFTVDFTISYPPVLIQTQ